MPNLDAILVACSGGSLAAGVSAAARAIDPGGCKVVVVEPLGKDLGPSLRAGRRLWPAGPPRSVRTAAEGIRTQQLGRLTFPIVCRHAEKRKYGRSRICVTQYTVRTKI